MNQFTELRQRISPYILVTVAFGSYVIIFADYHNRMGTGVASLATIPVIIAGWYFGKRGGLTIAFLSIITSIFLQSFDGHTVKALLSDPGNILRIIALNLVALVTGTLSAITRER